MEFRYLGNSGLKVSAVSYGNWVTHGSQVEADQATACVRVVLAVLMDPSKSSGGRWARPSRAMSPGGT